MPLVARHLNSILSLPRFTPVWVPPWEPRHLLLNLLNNQKQDADLNMTESAICRLWIWNKRFIVTCWSRPHSDDAEHPVATMMGKKTTQWLAEAEGHVCVTLHCCSYITIQTLIILENNNKQSTTVAKHRDNKRSIP